MICYHGSDTVVDSPKILAAKRPLDFGGGFYVTSNKEQAKSWAIRVCYRNNTHHVCVNRYDFDLEAAEKALTIIRFDVADERWLDFICKNRSGEDAGLYDIVIGPVAECGRSRYGCALHSAGRELRGRSIIQPRCGEAL